MKTLQQIIEAMNGSRKTLYILCGLPYSGKSHLAREILKGTSCAYVSIDSILEKLGYDWNRDHLPDEQGWEKVMEASYDETRQTLLAGSNVLYDSTNHTKVSRDALREIAEKASAQAQVIYIECPIETVRERWHENKTSKKRFVLSEKLLEMTIAALEAPTEEEHPWTIEN